MFWRVCVCVFVHLCLCVHQMVLSCLRGRLLYICVQILSSLVVITGFVCMPLIVCVSFCVQANLRSSFRLSEGPVHSSSYSSSSCHSLLHPSVLVLTAPPLPRPSGSSSPQQLRRSIQAFSSHLPPNELT